MAQLSDDMYCSQQIVVPPMFPYILRQYAKAAIRSQPSDLLRWSSAYFRCLSLNVPPPIKPRLEYPLTKGYEGVTPGWLRALLHAFANCPQVAFKPLWELWIGACQQHAVLVKILCLGGFPDRERIPLVRFIALCAALLSDNLTQTMLLLCEVVTEEPEGGSAMMAAMSFLDAYTFLAAIDASRSQVIENRYFTDEALDLLEKVAATKARMTTLPEAPDATDVHHPGADLRIEEEEDVKPEEVHKEEISCPDLLADEVALVAASMDQLHVDHSKESLVEDAQRIKDATSDIVGRKRPTALWDFSKDHVDAPGAPTDEVGEEVGETSVMAGMVEEAEDGAEEKESSEAADDGDDELKDDVDDDGIRKYLAEAHGEMSTTSSSSDTEKWPFVCAELATGAQEQPDASEVDTEVSRDTTTKFQVEEVFVEAVPGIGAVVPADLVDTVVAFVKKCAAQQHGMIMPRNIRHYSCPPLHLEE